MSGTNASPITIADAMDTMKDVDDCIKEIDSIMGRLAIMDRQLVAQENYINLSKLNTSYRINLYKHRHTETVKWDNGLGVRRIERNLLMISSTMNHSLVLNNDGRVYSFGWNQYGQLGHVGTSRDDVTTPTESNISNITAISAGKGHSMVLRNDGKVYSFGGNDFGQLGLDNRDNRLVPTQININNIIAISAGGFHSLVLTEDGKVYSFGRNNYCQLGFDDKAKRSVPTKIPNIYTTGSGYYEDRIKVSNYKIKAISAGRNHNLLLSEDGKVYSFGDNSKGQLGRYTEYTVNGNGRLAAEPTIIDVSAISTNKIIAISAGGNHSLVLSEDGKVHSFGDNSKYQSGQGKEKIYIPDYLAWTIPDYLAWTIDAQLNYQRNNPFKIHYAYQIVDIHTVDQNPFISNFDKNAAEKLVVKSGGGYNIPIFNNSQILPDFVSSGTPGENDKDPERIVLTGVNKDLEVFNGVDIMGTKQFLIGVNAILTHPNNITETLPPNIVIVSPRLESNEKWRKHNWNLNTDNAGHIGDWGVNVCSDVSAGLFHSLVLTENGKVYSFGNNSYYQLGLGGTDTDSKSVPTQIDTSIIGSNNRITAISAGHYHSFVLLTLYHHTTS